MGHANSSDKVGIFCRSLNSVNLCTTGMEVKLSQKATVWIKIKFTFFITVPIKMYDPKFATIPLQLQFLYD